MLQFLSKIVGQGNVVSILEKFINTSSIPHAILFAGKRGVGKYNAALQFTKAINSAIIENQTIKNKFNQLHEPYVKYIIPLNDAKTEKVLFDNSQKLSKEENSIRKKYNQVIEKKIANPYFNLNLTSSSSIRINQIRDIKKFLSVSYPEIPFRSIIIDHADLMTEEAQNSLLKNLEEPPEGIIFILLTSKIDKIFSTIKSRCQIINFDLLKDNDLSNILIENFQANKDNIKLILEFAEGSVFNAVQFIDYDIKNKHQEILNLLRFIATNKFEEAVRYFEKEEKDIESILLTFSLIKLWFNDCAKIKNGYSNIYFKEFEINIRNFIIKYSKTDFYKMDESLSRIIDSISKNINLTLLYLHAIFEIKQLSN